MSRAGFKPTIPAIKLPQTYALDRTAAGIGALNIYLRKINQEYSLNFSSLLCMLHAQHILSSVILLYNLKISWVEYKVMKLLFCSVLNNSFDSQQTHGIIIHDKAK
jgi:hypothetical protein